MLEVLLFVVAGVLALAGVVGCVVPAVPGPPLSFAALIAAWAARGWHAETFGWPAVAVVGALAALVTVVDTIAPAIGARRYGASRLGTWGSVVGMIVGLVAFPPFGVIVGAFVGALAGELVHGKPWGTSLRASWGVFLYTLLGIAVKLAVSLAVAVLLVRELL